MNILLLRHGESKASIENCYGGVTDFELSRIGIEQAFNISKSVKLYPLEAIFSSPLKRCIQTAIIINNNLDKKCSIETLENLSEWNSYGVLSGVEKRNAQKIFGYIINKSEVDPEFSRVGFMGSENLNIFIERVNSAFNQIINTSQRYGYQNILVVTHGKLLQVLLLDVLKVCKTFDYSFGKIFQIEFLPKDIIIRKITF